MSAPTFKKSKVSQKINLKEEFGIDFRGRDNLKQAIGQAIIDRIVTRSESGKGMSFSSEGKGREVSLKSPYSKEYADSLEFKAFGKSRGKVNMTLTGDMLGLMDIVNISGNTIEIGWDDNEQNAKAFNHSIGDTVPKRPFFGVSKKEIKDIKREFSSDIREALSVQRDEGRDAFDAFVLGLIDRIVGDGDNG